MMLLLSFLSPPARSLARAALPAVCEADTICARRRWRHSQVIEKTCEKHRAELVASPSLEDIVGYDQWARKYAEEVAQKMAPAVARLGDDEEGWGGVVGG